MKFTKQQKEKLEIMLAWYNFAWAMSNNRHRDEQKEIGAKAIEMIEEMLKHPPKDGVNK